MKKYLLVAKNTWAEVAAYRLNFFMWRFRQVLQLLTIYFLWAAIIPKGGHVFGYSQSLMLTYILGTALVNSFLSSRVWQTADEITKGDLSNYLIRPINYFTYWFFKNIGDKTSNIIFSIFEVAMIIVIVKPPIFLQTNLLFILLTAVALALAVFLQFFVDFLLSSIAFWSPETWAPRFIFFTLVGFFSGGLFPLDILPKPIFYFFEILPFSYLLYFPLKVYLGQVSSEQLIIGFMVSIVWVGGLYLILRFVWKKGMYSYTAQGR